MGSQRTPYYPNTGAASNQGSQQLRPRWSAPQLSRMPSQYTQPMQRGPRSSGASQTSRPTTVPQSGQVGSRPITGGQQMAPQVGRGPASRAPPSTGVRVSTQPGMSKYAGGSVRAQGSLPVSVQVNYLLTQF